MENKNNIPFKIPENKNPFSVPDNYFENLPQKIQEKIQIQNAYSENKGWKVVLKPQLALAASILLFAMISVLVVMNFSGQKQQAQLTADEIYTMFDNNHIDIDDEILLSELQPEDLTFTTSDNVDDIINYLDNDDIDNNILYENIN